MKIYLEADKNQDTIEGSCDYTRALPKDNSICQDCINPWLNKVWD